MYYSESFHRNKALGSKPRTMPALQYNEMRLLFQRCGQSCLFIPIRTLQYLAVIDHEEVIFVDSMRKAYVEFAWRKFIPQTRSSLDDVVPYDFVYYEPKALETIMRVQGEFAQAIHAMSIKQQAKVAYKTRNRTNRVIPFNECKDKKS